MQFTVEKQIEASMADWQIGSSKYFDVDSLGPVYTLSSPRVVVLNPLGILQKLLWMKTIRYQKGLLISRKYTKYRLGYMKIERWGMGFRTDLGEVAQIL